MDDRVNRSYSLMPPDWAGPSGGLGRFIQEQSDKTLEAYRSQPNFVTENAKNEDDLARGGYADRQLLELVQNSTDALAGTGGGHIRVKLTRSHLYCADDGLPIDEDGVRALMFSRLSPKRGSTQIGRYGLGFKSVLNVTDRPEFFSRSASFRFDRSRAQQRIQRRVPNARRWPTLRVPYAIDPQEEFSRDRTLRLLAVWASNIVRLPLKRKALKRLSVQINTFPPEFLLFAEHIRDLIVDIVDVEDEEVGRTFRCKKEADRFLLTEDDKTSVWKIFQRRHDLSKDAQADSRDVDGEDRVDITWAVPLARLNEPGYFWKFFPTMTPSLVAGILNAQWKTNTDRQNLLPGPKNRELIQEAATLIADSMPQLMTADDPARHLDALPRRKEAGDNELTNFLRERLLSKLASLDVVPDQDGKLRGIRNISYPPKDLPLETLQMWAAYRGRPSGWLHHTANIRTRPATIDRIFQTARGYRWASAPRTTISEWLEALVEDANSEEESVQASMAAIQTAVSIPENIRRNHSLGRIALTATCEWSEPNPDRLYLGGGESPSEKYYVHPQLEADTETLYALKQLGIGDPPSKVLLRQKEKRLHRALAVALTDPRRSDKFWTLSRESHQPSVVKLIRDRSNWYQKLHILNLNGNWQRFSHSLLPGPIVPADGSRDSHMTIDTEYHRADLAILEELGASSIPYDNYLYKELDSKGFLKFRSVCVNKYKDSISGNPHKNKLIFGPETMVTSGPLHLLRCLTNEGRALYTNHLLQLNSTYTIWRMYHESRLNNASYSWSKGYKIKTYWSPAIEILRSHGYVRLSYGIAKLSYGLGAEPKNLDVRHWLLAHKNSKQIRKAFNIRLGTAIDPEGDE